MYVHACVCVCMCVYLYYVLLCTSLVFVYSSRRHGHQDPHKKLLGKNVLIICGSLEKAEHFKMAEEDNKILTAWNGERSGPRKVMRVYLEINAVDLVLHIRRPFSVCHIYNKYYYHAKK